MFAFFNAKLSFDVCIKQTQQIAKQRAVFNKPQRAKFSLFSGVLNQSEEEAKILTAQITAGI